MEPHGTPECRAALHAAALLTTGRGSRAPASSGCTVRAAQASRNFTVLSSGILSLEIMNLTTCQRAQETLTSA